MTSQMGPKDLIDAPFDRAVEIVQGLPKTGPVQTDYDEKLVMYSLYKQATVGNVKSPRPGIWDMLGRAKWDAWAKHKDLDSHEAKRLYVEALLKVLRRYSDKTIAKSLVDELESYGGGLLNFTRSRMSSYSTQDLGPEYETLGNSGASSNSGSSASSASTGSPRSPYAQVPLADGQSTEENDSEEDQDEPGNLPATNTNPPTSYLGRPTSSMSTNRYRTPLAGSHFTSPPPSHVVPDAQPGPPFGTPSVFADPEFSRSPAGSGFLQSSYVGQRQEPLHSGLVSPPLTAYRSSQHRGNSQLSSGQLASRVALERAVEHLQAQVAAIQERLETLEASSRYLSKSLTLPSPRGGSPNDGRRELGGTSVI